MKHIHQQFCILGAATLIFHAPSSATVSQIPPLRQDKKGRHRRNGFSTQHPRHSSDLSSLNVSSTLLSEPLNSKASETLISGHEAASTKQQCSTNGSGKYGSQTDLEISLSYNYRLEITNGTMLSNVLPALEIALGDSLLSALFTECHDDVAASARTIHTKTMENNNDNNHGHRMLQDVNVAGINSLPLDVKKGENKMPWCPSGGLYRTPHNTRNSISLTIIILF